MRTLVLLASACLVGGTVEAQATSQGRVRTTEEARRAGSDAAIMRDRVMHRVMVDDSARMNRATLGVTLGGAAHKRDTLGVFVEAVAEDGPAERAGIYEGHRIAFVNGIDVRATAADAGDAYLSGVGRHRLSRAMRDVTAGSTVTLRVWTGSGYRDVQVTSGRFADVYRNQRFGGMFGDGAPSGFGFAPTPTGRRRYTI
ncbi:MAG: PDZ domain-containing protein [Gemmatimonadaceae bacterium]